MRSEGKKKEKEKTWNNFAVTFPVYKSVDLWDPQKMNKQGQSQQNTTVKGQRG